MLNALTWMASLGLFANVALHAPSDLVAAAAASGRPAECMPHARSGSTRRDGVWSRARIPNLQQYCGLIARAHARMQENTASARKAAIEADALVPNRAAPQVVLARVARLLGDLPAAQKAFDLALSRDPRAVEQPLAMHDHALVQWRTGKLQDALATFRVLVPRAALLPSRAHRARVLLEAAHVAMAVAQSNEARSSRDVVRSSHVLDEAIAYLREAQRDSHHPLALDVSLSLVLALDRAGRARQADALLSEQRKSSTWANTVTVDYLETQDDLHVLRGLAVELRDPAAAAKSYRRYLESPSGKGAYADAVKMRLDRLAPARTPRRGGRGER